MLLELHRLEREADDLLVEISRSGPPVAAGLLARLESIAGAAAKIAFGSGNPSAISEQMRRLISWTDHLDDAPWVTRFHQALISRPLKSPWSLDKKGDAEG